MILLPLFMHSQTFTFKSQTIDMERVTTGIYKNNEGKEFRIKDNFFVKIDKDAKVETILNQYDLSILKSYSKQLYLLKSNKSELLELIEEVDGDIDVVYAYPNFYKKLEKR